MIHARLPAPSAWRHPSSRTKPHGPRYVERAVHTHCTAAGCMQPHAPKTAACAVTIPAVLGLQKRGASHLVPRRACRCRAGLSAPPLPPPRAASAVQRWRQRGAAVDSQNLFDAPRPAAGLQPRGACALGWSCCPPCCRRCNGCSCCSQRVLRIAGGAGVCGGAGHLRLGHLRLAAPVLRVAGAAHVAQLDQASLLLCCRRLLRAAPESATERCGQAAQAPQRGTTCRRRRRLLLCCRRLHCCCLPAERQVGGEAAAGGGLVRESVVGGSSSRELFRKP